MIYNHFQVTVETTNTGAKLVATWVCALEAILSVTELYTVMVEKTKKIVVRIKGNFICILSFAIKFFFKYKKKTFQVIRIH